MATSGQTVTVLANYVSLSQAALKISLTPTNVPNFIPGWRFTGGTTYTTNFTSTVSVTGGTNYSIEFLLVPGFIAPTNRTVLTVANQTNTVQGNYVPVLPVLTFLSRTNLTFTGATGATYRVDFSTNLAGAVWSPLVTQKLVTTSGTVTNFGPATNRARFFRTVLLP